VFLAHLFFLSALSIKSMYHRNDVMTTVNAAASVKERRIFVSLALLKYLPMDAYSDAGNVGLCLDQ